MLRFVEKVFIRFAVFRCTWGFFRKRGRSLAIRTEIYARSRLACLLGQTSNIQTLQLFLRQLSELLIVLSYLLISPRRKPSRPSESHFAAQINECDVRLLQEASEQRTNLIGCLQQNTISRLFIRHRCHFFFHSFLRWTSCFVCLCVLDTNRHVKYSRWFIYLFIFAPFRHSWLWAMTCMQSSTLQKERKIKRKHPEKENYQWFHFALNRVIVWKKNKKQHFVLESIFIDWIYELSVQCSMLLCNCLHRSAFAKFSILIGQQVFSHFPKKPLIMAATRQVVCLLWSLKLSFYCFYTNDLHMDWFVVLKNVRKM